MSRGPFLSVRCICGAASTHVPTNEGALEQTSVCSRCGAPMSVTLAKAPNGMLQASGAVFVMAAVDVHQKPLPRRRCGSIGCLNLAEPGLAECEEHLRFAEEWQELVGSIDTREPVGVRFHGHLNACAHCREHPFALCPIGAELLAEIKK